jgi:hypothetical protein
MQYRNEIEEDSLPDPYSSTAAETMQIASSTLDNVGEASLI